MRRFAVIWLFANCLFAQQSNSLDTGRQLLYHVRQRVMQTVERLPKYLCTETVDRATLVPPADAVTGPCGESKTRTRNKELKMRKRIADRLRLEVAISSEGEMFSWIGEDRFNDRSLADLVQGGATSTGTFASFLRAIFASDAASFTFNGSPGSGDDQLVEFAFQVPLERSKYFFGTKQHEAAIGYGGTFLVDPNTYDLVRLTIHSDQIPPELHICNTETALDYSQMRLNDVEFLIPRQADWRVTKIDGTEFDSRMVFSACHEFHAESKISFDDTSDAETAKGEKGDRKTLTLTPGLVFSAALTKSIETVTAAAGDPIYAKLANPIRDKLTGASIPKGAAVSGRIANIERHYGTGPELLTLAIRFETIEVDGRFQPLHARLDSAVMKQGRPLNVIASRQNLGSFDHTFDSENPSAAFLEFVDVSDHYVIHRGVQIECRTTEAAAK